MCSCTLHFKCMYINTISSGSLFIYIYDFYTNLYLFLCYTQNKVRFRKGSFHLQLSFQNNFFSRCQVGLPQCKYFESSCNLTSFYQLLLPLTLFLVVIYCFRTHDLPIYDLRSTKCRVKKRENINMTICFYPSY